jgi:hypothetical protein
MAPLARILNTLLIGWLCLHTLAAAGVAEFVMCFGQDGHMALEKTYAIDGVGQASCSLPGSIESDSERIHCGKCNDVPLSISASDPAHASRIADADAPLSAAVAFEPDRILPAPAFRHSAFTPIPFRHSALTDTRTVVLRL